MQISCNRFKWKIIRNSNSISNRTTKRYSPEQQKVIEGFIEKYKINMIAIGNGTASRESEMFLSELISKNKNELYYAIVSEAGASVYSASKLCNRRISRYKCFTKRSNIDSQKTSRSTCRISKIDPKAIGVGQYQHDVNQKKLSESLTGVVEDAVNSVGVDVNTATPSLLSYVSGINKTIAKNIVEYRDSNGSLKQRKELLKVPKLGKSAF